MLLYRATEYQSARGCKEGKHNTKTERVWIIKMYGKAPKIFKPNIYSYI